MVRPGLLSTWLISGAALVAGSAAAAGLPVDGWPQSRRDAAQSGLIPEPGLAATPRIKWTADTLALPLAGEPIVSGCEIYLTTGFGEVAALRVGDGGERWRAPNPSFTPPVNVSSALAYDDSGLVVAGLPGDRVVGQIWRTVPTLRVAIESYMVDHGFCPAGPDLEPSLVPDYLTRMPANPVTGAKIAFSATASTGDYFYECITPDRWGLGIWWPDGDYVVGSSACGILPPGWPLSDSRGGLPSAHGAADGGLRWRIANDWPSLQLVPTLSRDVAIWAASEESARSPDFAPRGRLRATGLDGSPRWDVSTLGPLRGGAARDAATGDLFVASGPDLSAVAIDFLVRSLGTAIESYQVDNGYAPPTGELEPWIVPDFLGCMPRHPLLERAIQYAATPAPGDYVYTGDRTLGTYELAIWGEDGDKAAIWANGFWVEHATNQPPAVLGYDESGTRRWRTSIGTPVTDLSPVALGPGGVAGAVIVGTSGGDVVALDVGTGGEQWRTPVGGSLIAAPAIAATGEIVVVTTDGVMHLLGSTGSLAWSYPTLSPTQAAPTVTIDGLVYLAGLDGTLRAVDIVGRRLAWQVAIGGSLSAGLTTSAIQSDGWLFVGRDDGILVALTSPITRGGSPPIGNTMMLVRGGADVVFSWTPVGGFPIGCRHVVRSSVDPVRFPSDPRVALVPPDAPRDVGVIGLAPDLVFYRVHAESCCGIEGP